MSTEGRSHTYRIAVEWTGNCGPGTADYRAYKRDHSIAAANKPDILGSSDPSFRGDASRWNPEDLLVASLAACHKLWYLGLCAANGIAVLAYRDEAIGTMIEDPASDGGGGRFARVLLTPRVTVRATDDVALAERLHAEAHARCFIANSVNFPVDHRPIVARDDGRSSAAASTDHHHA